MDMREAQNGKKTTTYDVKKVTRTRGAKIVPANQEFYIRTLARGTYCRLGISTVKNFLSPTASVWFLSEHVGCFRRGVQVEVEGKCSACVVFVGSAAYSFLPSLLLVRLAALDSNILSRCKADRVVPSRKSLIASNSTFESDTRRQDIKRSLGHLLVNT